ncbi:MAG: hypothetical protein QXY55_02460 [Candidatus Korarchaeota archaeon]
MCGRGSKVNWTVASNVSLLAPESLQLAQALLEKGDLTSIAAPAILGIFKKILAAFTEFGKRL